MTGLAPPGFRRNSTQRLSHVTAYSAWGAAASAARMEDEDTNGEAVSIIYSVCMNAWVERCGGIKDPRDQVVESSEIRFGCEIRENGMHRAISKLENVP